VRAALSAGNDGYIQSRFSAYGLLNVVAGLRSNGPGDVSLSVRNLRDEDYMQNLTVQAGNSGLIVGTPSEPRSHGVTLRAKFQGAGSGLRVRLKSHLRDRSHPQVRIHAHIGRCGAGRGRGAIRRANSLRHVQGRRRIQYTAPSS